ncbi:MAG: hypothetical protein Tsb009_27900 [Planctomycetaceae bacterium]
MPTEADLWNFLPWGYLLTVCIELPILWLGLSQPHSIRTRLIAGFGLTAITYPIVILVLPVLVWQPFGRIAYLSVAETFAPLVECLVFYLAFEQEKRSANVARDMATILAANVCSFVGGEFMISHWFSA